MSVEHSGGGALDACVTEPPLVRLRELLLEEGGLMRALVFADAPAPAGGTVSAPLHGPDGPTPAPASVRGSAAPAPAHGPAQLVAAGPRAQGARAEYELLVETIYEGYLLHYHAARVVRAPEADLGLLAGDRLYALGLARLVRLGDIEGVAELADVITLAALAHAAGLPELAAAVWMAGARAVGWGATPEHERAKALVRAGSPEALAALRALGAGGD